MLTSSRTEVIWSYMNETDMDSQEEVEELLVHLPLSQCITTVALVSVLSPTQEVLRIDSLCFLHRTPWLYKFTF